MESLVNEEVRHPKFGKGSIVEEPSEHIKVRFHGSGTVKTFLFPDAFDGFLAFEKGELQETYGPMAAQARSRKEDGRMEAIHKREEERKLAQEELVKHRKSTARTTRTAAKTAK